MRRPSVIFMNRVYPPGRGATGRVLRDLARSFAREGWQVTVITTGEKASKDRDGAVKVIRLKGPAKPGGAFSYAWVWLKMLITALRQPATTLLVTQSDPPFLAVAGQIIKKFKGSRHIHWCHDIYPDLFPALGVRFPDFVMAGLERVMRGALQTADKVIVVGRCMARQLSYTGIDPKHITMIPNWPDLELSADPHAADAPVQTRGLPPEKVWYEGAKPFEQQIKDEPKFRILYAGNIGLAHPIDAILAAAEILDKDNPEIEFVFVGDGPRFDELSKERAARGLHNIRLLPYQPARRLAQIMESGDVHLVSMAEEAAGLMVPCKLYSAFAAARPCLFLGPAASEAAKVVQDYHAGAVVAPGDVEGLVAQIRHYRFNSEAWFAAQKGARDAGAVFVPEQAIDAWIDRAWSVVKDEVKGETRKRVRSVAPPSKLTQDQQGAPQERQPEKEVEAA